MTGQHCRQPVGRLEHYANLNGDGFRFRVGNIGEHRHGDRHGDFQSECVCLGDADRDGYGGVHKVDHLKPDERFRERQ